MKPFQVILALFALLGVGTIHAQQMDTLQNITLTHDGMTHRYLLYIPSQATDSESFPLVLVLHGGGGHPELYADVTGFNELAETEGFIVAYPAGTNRRNTERLLAWNAGFCCGHAQTSDVDDVGFIAALVEDVRANYPVDPNRVYAAGHSNGGMLTYQLAAELPDVFAAVGVVAGSMGGDGLQTQTPQSPVSVLHIHGQEDQNVPYAGGEGDAGVTTIDFLSVADSLAPWLEVNACDTPPIQQISDDGMVTTETYDCTTGTQVQLITITDGGHAWPGARENARRSAPASERLDATAALWAFFVANPRLDND